MELKKELSLLKTYMDTMDESKVKEQTDHIHKHFASEDDKKEIEAFLQSELSGISEQTKDLIKRAESTLIRMQLKEISEFISLSYVAKMYFKKDRSWLHQKINGNVKNGKPAKFTNSEIETFNFALQDISKKIGSIAIHP
jgi:hypothetical protein